MLTRDFPLKVKALDEASGTFTGIASPYGEPDASGDIIEPGAFTQAIRQQGQGYPLLWCHQQDQPIGIGKIEDSRDGLVVHGSLVMDDPVARKAHAHLLKGSVKGLSIGYLPAGGEGKTIYRKDGGRTLKEIRLFEISAVPVPMAPRAQITSVKSLGDVHELLHGLRSDEVDEEALGHLQGIDFELKRLQATSPDRQATMLKELQAFAIDLQRTIGR